MSGRRIPDVQDTDLTREELEEVAEEVGVDAEGLDDQQLLEQLGVALGELDEDDIETPTRSTSEGDGRSDEEEAGDEPYDEMTRDELRDELRKRELPVSGNKDELVERLSEDDGG